MIQGCGGFLLLPGAPCGCGGGCRAGGCGGFRCVLLCLPIMMQIKILNSIKTKGTLSLCRKSVCCVALQGQMMFLSARGGLYNIRSSPILDANSRIKSDQLGLVWKIFVGGCYGLSVYRLPW